MDTDMEEEAQKEISQVGVRHDMELPPQLGFTITHDFLEFAFQRKVARFTVTPGTNPGDNFMSIMHAVEVTFKGEEEAQKQHYLIKCYPNHPARRERLDQIKIFDRELFIYQNFLPALNQTMKESGADKQLVGLSSAPFHGGNVAGSPSLKWRDTKWAKEHFIIMTDIRKSGFSMPDRFQGLDLEHSILVLEEIAKWHALAWAHKKRNGWPLLSAKYPELIEILYSDQGMRSYFDEVNQNALKMTEECLGADHPAHVSFKMVADRNVIDIFGKFMRPHGIDEKVFEDLLRIKPEYDPDYNEEPWLTGTHGDCWMNNMLFRYDDHDHPKPVQLTFVDLQTYREACPTVDIAFFLSTSVRAPIRIPNTDKLLQAYHDSFLRCCHELKVKLYPGFSLTSLKRRYRRAQLYSFLMAVEMLPFILKPVEETVDLDEIFKDGDGKEDANDIYSKVAEGSDKNGKIREELIPTLLDLYEEGII